MTGAPAVAKTLPEELFLQRYDQLLKWATRLTKPDRELAKDLVQESFLQFSASAGDLSAINNIDQYLYGLVRNTYLSYLRRTSRYDAVPLDVEVAVNLHLTTDPRQQIQARDKLVAICQIACARKETSVAASLLILRFFHGYLPEEIARLTHRTRNVVDVQLKLARWEISSTGNQRIGVRKKGSLGVSQKLKRSQPTGDLLTELREKIFATRRGDCLDEEQFKKLHNSRSPVSRNRVSHLVSCINCLEEANRVLGLPPLRERNALDALGRAKGESQTGRLYTLFHTGIMLVGGTIWALLNVADALC